MNFAFSDEQEELRTAVRRFLAEKSPETEVRRLMETTEGYDPAVWRQMADQLGLQSLTIPEEFGGSGFSYVELVVVLEEMGAALLCAPFFSTVALAANAVLTSGDDEAKKYLLPGLASGETIGTLAITEDNGRWDFGGIELAAEPSGDGWVLNGHKMFVLDGHVANLIVVAARTSKGVSLFGVKDDAAGLTRTPLPTMDQTRKQARLEFSGTPAWLIGTDGGAEPGLSKTLDLAAVALAAEQVGGAQRVLDMSVEYAKTRIQFGRPIGSFQALRHRIADLATEIEATRLLVYDLAARADANPGQLYPREASMAKLKATETAKRVALEGMQMMGGYGYAVEYDMERHVRTAVVSTIYGGTSEIQREIISKTYGL
jgi:alkylation response protein AidB-like acyl-CoA dehydrogenase